MFKKSALYIIMVLCILLNCTFVNAAGAGDISASYSEDAKTVIISGKLEEGANARISAMLIKKATETNNPSVGDIGYVGETATDKNGSYTFRFRFNNNIDDYNLIVNQNGQNVTDTVISMVSIYDIYDIEYITNLDSESLTAHVRINNPYMNENDACDIILASYNKDNKMTNVQIFDKNQINTYSSTQIDKRIEVPEDTAYAKVFIWRSINSMTPLKETKNIDKTPYTNYINYRGSISNTFKKLEKDNKLNIVFFGGSVTDGYGSTNMDEKSWRAMIGQWFNEKYPNADITTVNAAIGGTGSNFGEYRLEKDVLNYNPDLVFMMFAINDIYCGENAASTERQFETIIRRIYAKNPNADIIIMFDGNRETASYCLDNNALLYSIFKNQDDMAQYYNISTINPFMAMINSIGSEGIKSDDVWYSYMKDSVHPADKGYRYFADVIQTYLEAERANCDYTNLDLTAKTLPEIKTTMLSSHFIEAKDLVPESNVGWSYNANYKLKNLVGAYVAANSSSEFSYKVSGNEISIYIGAGELVYSIDGGEDKTITSTAVGPVNLDRNLVSGEHTVTFKSTSSTPEIYAIMYR